MTLRAKRLIGIFISITMVFTILLSMSVTRSLADPTPSPTQSPTDGTVESMDNIISIDNNAKLPGETKRYSNGYDPTDNKDRVMILKIPLTLDAGYKVWGVKVSPVISDVSTYPFVVSNSTKSLKFDASTRRAYIEFKFKVDKDTTNGDYIIPFDIKYSYSNESENKSGDGTSSISVYCHVSHGKSPASTDDGGNDAGGGGGTVSDPDKPNIIIKECVPNPKEVLAGKEFTLELTLANTSKKAKASTINVSVKSEEGVILPSNGSVSQFIDSLAKDSETKLEYKLITRGDTTAKVQPLSINITYKDSDGNPLEASDSITIPIKQEIRIKLDEPQLGNPIYANEITEVSMNVYNMGKSTVNNVLATVEGTGFAPGASYFGGNLEPGQKITVSLEITPVMEGGDTDPLLEESVPDDGGDGVGIVPEIKNKLMFGAPLKLTKSDTPSEDTGSEGDGTTVDSDDVDTGDESADDASIAADSEDTTLSEPSSVPSDNTGDATGGDLVNQVLEGSPGMISGKIILTYEDDNGTQHKEEKTFSGMISEQEPDIPEDPGINGEAEDENALSWWVYLAIAVAAIIILIVVIVLVRKAKRRKAILEDEDE